MRDYRCKILEIEGARNIRDIGGYEGRGGPLRYGRFLRAASLAGLTENGVRQLLEAGVGCVVDLRSGYERAKYPNRLGSADGVVEENIPMMDYIQSELVHDRSWFPASMEEIYLSVLRESGEAFRRAFEIFAREEHECILFHCTAGKDRTGMTAMLLLALAGVDEDTIAEDYSYSHELNQTAYVPGIPEFVYYSNESTIRHAMDMLKHEYGGMPGYLERIGVTREQREAICRKLGVEPI